VIHKLGHGECSTFWMARHTQDHRYVALKILIAGPESCEELHILHYLQYRPSNHPGRNYIALVTGRFLIEGPNGSHVCLVSVVQGPSIL
jgi:hypothetical protein